MNASSINTDQLQKSFLELSQTVTELGYRNNINQRLAMLEYLSHIVLHMLFFGLAIYYRENLWLCLPLFWLMMLSGIGITSGTHTASHHSLVHNRKLNDFFVYLGYGFFFGASREYWNHKHLKVHHPNPNIVGIDEDINLMPWFVMNTDDYKQASRLKKVYFRLQFLIFPLALTLNLFNVQKDGFIHLFRLINDKGFTRRVKIDIAVVASHFLCWIIIPAFFFGLPIVLFFYFIRAALIGYGMFAAFAPAHFPENAIFLTEQNKNLGFVAKQIYTTTNFTTGPVGRYILGGVQYQLEHHLFPNCHHYHYPEISRLLREFCKDNHLPYNELSWFDGVAQSFKVFYQPKEVNQSI